ncbi:nuclear transport factor 2 family protein [Priestia megaterium]|uniref:nuclear transport factor 2 family protein n=1 Tax=Priestia megaterium TaxID=1404 RepID=UPI001F5E8F5B|nr:nuclear transport factor 2 family protein [Priestia megaterium]
MMNDNLTVNNINKSEGEQILEQFLKFMLEKDMDKWIDLWDEHAIFEFPFGPSNYPEKIEGKSNIYNYIKDFPKKINLFKFSIPQIHHTLNSNILIAEFKCEGQIINTGLPYKQKYISVIEISNGKISYYKDYWNPLVAIESFGGNLASFLDSSHNLKQ